VREQRDGLARGRERLLALLRQMQAENEALRRELGRYQNIPAAHVQQQERADAERLEREHDIPFSFMPDGVYPGKPYVTQLDLIRRGITRYSRQNISRLIHQEGSVPALAIADRVLLPPAGVRALLRREARAALDVSPRRRPGGKRAAASRR
jgi:hypothetical protein